ncbi:amphoterin-induced protein 3 [Conger conger]|uniref:amphoterin-induced protein 3 n=1 Tax=Conger conger TaxID=82655 RepID=UPI002A59D39D|nr:amphoterin-induced protein 3 [Conger conger]
MRGAQGVAGSLVVSSLLLQLAGAGGCPSGCLCTADILSCGAQGLEQLPAQMPAYVATLDFNHNRLARLEEGGFAGLPRLETLRVAHNRLSRIAPRAFHNVSRLRHLDLSSNELHVVEQHYFLELLGLEELLLFDNRITRVESKALTGLSNLRKAYFSHNRLTDFPFFSIQEHSHPSLRTLDLSSNRLPRLPLEDIAALPANVQSGLFLHNNTLICECAMYGLFRRWDQRAYASVLDYREEHTCLVYGERRASVRFFQPARLFENCPAQSFLAERAVSVQAQEGDSVLLDCPTSLRKRRGSQRHLSYLWVSPEQEYVVPPGNNGSLRMFANGSLQVVSARRQDSGVYLCMALDRRPPPANESHEVNVTVAARRGAEDEAFNTGFTTLLGCVVSLVLVLMYLYLTPCQCWCRRQPPAPPAGAAPGTAPAAHEGSGQSSILTPTPPATTEGPGRKASGNSKHVVFLEPIKEVQNGRLRSTLAVPTEHAKPQPLRGDTDSVASVFSDVPIVP